MTELLEEALAEVGRAVRLERVEEGWEAQLEPWEELKLRRMRSARYLPRRLHMPPVMYELRLDRDLAITSCTGAEGASVAEQVLTQLRTTLDRRVREPIERQKEEEALRRPRVPPAELEREYQEAKRREDWARTASFLENEALELILFGGKGGAGKTTSAAATGLRLARLRPEKRILVVSIDPAHSLADSLDCPVGGEPTPVNGTGNLWAMELEARRLHDEFRARHDEAMRKIAYRGSIFDPRDIADIFSLALPGIDEFMAIVEIANIRREGSYDLIILDTAPTGHLLRFLELPELVGHWLKVIFTIQIRSKIVAPLTHLENLNKRLIELSRGTRRVRETLLNPQTTESVAVTIPEAMGLLEMEDLLAALKKLGIPCRHIIVNKIIPPGRCSFCSAKREEQQEYVRQVGEAKGAEYLITEVELFPHQIRGLDDLREYAARIF